MGRAQAQPPSSRPVAALQPPCSPLRSCPAADLHLPTCAAPRLPFSRLAPALYPTPTQPCPLRVRTGALTELGAGGARHPPHPPATPERRHRGRRRRGRGSRRRVRRAAARTRCRRGRRRRGELESIAGVSRSPGADADVAIRPRAAAPHWGNEIRSLQGCVPPPSIFRRSHSSTSAVPVPIQYWNSTDSGISENQRARTRAE